MIRVRFKKFKIKKLKKEVKGLKKSNLFRISNQKYIKKLCNQFISRKLKKRIFRSKWINFINGQLKQYNLKYSLFISILKSQGILLNINILYINRKNVIKEKR